VFDDAELAAKVQNIVIPVSIVDRERERGSTATRPSSCRTSTARTPSPR
jgi:hypothetical protein